MSDGMVAGGFVALFFVGVGALLSYFFKKPSVVSLLVNSVLIFFGATFLNAILVFRNEYFSRCFCGNNISGNVYSFDFCRAS